MQVHFEHSGLYLDGPTAIHMGFDCMAIGVGLLASVMATWPPNEQFTYGSGLMVFLECTYIDFRPS